MEISTPVACSLGRAHNGDFALVPHEIIEKKIMPYFATLKHSPLLHARTFHALCKSNKYFSQFLKDPKINELLIKNMASYNNKKKKWTPIIEKKLIFSAAFQLNTVGARLYIKTFGQPPSWDYDVPVLSTVIEYPKSDQICKFALQCGINPNYVWWGSSALQVSVTTNRLKCVKVLLSHGADPNNYNSNYEGAWVRAIPQYLPLRLALMNNASHRIISNLLIYGANPLLKDLSGESPLDLARKIRMNRKTLQSIEDYAQRFKPVENNG
jgi:hypothetical protein